MTQRGRLSMCWRIDAVGVIGGAVLAAALYLGGIAPMVKEQAAHRARQEALVDHQHVAAKLRASVSQLEEAIAETQTALEQTAVHLSDAIDADRLHQHVNGYRVDVVDPLQTLRITLEETEGVAADLTWNGLFGVVQEQRHVMRSGTRVTLDAQRFAQLGS